KQPGVHLAPAGITVRELIDEYCGGMLDGHEFYAYLPGGASGGILPATKGDVPLDFDTLQPYGSFIGSAAVVILSQRDSAAAAAANLMKFFHEESCGKCTPCRVGTAKALALMGESKWTQPLLGELSQGMEVTTDSARALTSQKMVLELLLADMPEHEYTLSNKVDVWARKLKVGKPRFRSRPQPRADLSHPAIAVNLDACIQCTRCVR